MAVRKANFVEELTNVGADLIIGFQPSASPENEINPN